MVEGDDIVDRLDDLQAAGETLAHLDTGQPLAAAGVKPVTANAYLGGWGISAALAAGADVVVCCPGDRRLARRPVRPPGGTAGTARTGTASPGRSSPATSSSAARRRPAATPFLDELPVPGHRGRACFCRSFKVIMSRFV